MNKIIHKSLIKVIIGNSEAVILINSVKHNVYLEFMSR